MYKTNRASVPASSEVEYFYKEAKAQSPTLIFLHGFGETFQHMMRHFENKLPKELGVLAINGVFPLAQKIPHTDEWKLRFCWYFYDSGKNKYYINQRYPSEVIAALLKKLDLWEADKVIIGYSQGGYLAPFLGTQIINVRKCIAINAQYKHEMLPKVCPFALINICGEDDHIVDPENCKKSHQIMIERGNIGEFICIPKSKHSIDDKIVQSVIQQIELSMT